MGMSPGERNARAGHQKENSGGNNSGGNGGNKKSAAERRAEKIASQIEKDPAAAAAGLGPRVGNTTNVRQGFARTALGKSMFGDEVARGSLTPNEIRELGTLSGNSSLNSRRNINQALGMNPTTGMGILDSFRANFKGPQARQDIARTKNIAKTLPSGINMLSRLFGKPDIINKNFTTADMLGLNPEEDARLRIMSTPEIADRTVFDQIFDEASTDPFADQELTQGPDLSINNDAFDLLGDTALAARQVLGKNPLSKLNPRMLSLAKPNPRLALPSPRLSLNPPINFKDPKFRNLKISNFGKTSGTGISTGSPFKGAGAFKSPTQTLGNLTPRNFKTDTKNFFTKNPFGKKTPLGLGIAGLSLAGLINNEDTETNADVLGQVENQSFLDRPMFNYDGTATNPIFNFDPLSFLGRQQNLNMGGSVQQSQLPPMFGPMSNGIGTLYRQK